MSTMITKVSAVEMFARETVTQYNQIAAIAQELLTSMGRMVAFVEDERFKLDKQSMYLSQISDTLRIKLNKIIEEVRNAQQYRDYCSDAYRAADDYDMISYWRGELSSAQKEYHDWLESYEIAVQLQKELEQKKQQIYNLQRAMMLMVNALQQNVMEAKKIIAVFNEEADYNSRCLTDLVNRVTGYCMALPLGVPGGTSSAKYIGSATSGSATASSGKKAKNYKLKNTFGYDSDGKRHLYKLYIPQAQPIKQMLYDIMQGLHTNIRDAIMKELEGVEFLSARHGFFYGTSQRGKRLRIIGVDISDPSFNTLLLMHVGHHIYETNKTKERIAFDSCVEYDIKRNLTIADSKMRKMAMDFTPVDSVKQYAKHSDFRFKSAGSKFFSQCFKAYVSEDYEFLKVVKENFGDSYNAFLEIITKLPNR